MRKIVDSLEDAVEDQASGAQAVRILVERREGWSTRAREGRRERGRRSSWTKKQGSVRSNIRET